MNQLTLKHGAVECPFPKVLTRELDRETGAYRYGSATLKESLYRVSPRTGADVAFLQRLVRDKERFVPFTGEGLLISHNALMSC